MVEIITERLRSSLHMNLVVANQTAKPVAAFQSSKPAKEIKRVYSKPNELCMKDARAGDLPFPKVLTRGCVHRPPVRWHRLRALAFQDASLS